MRETFCLSDTGGNVLQRNSSIAMLFNWLIEHHYFQEHPGSVLTLTEENTPKFTFEVWENTASRNAVTAWNGYNHYI